jgi:hypothetical protein
MLYADLSLSRQTVLETLGYDIIDETERRQSENEKNLNEVFQPYMTAYTNNGLYEDEGGRPADRESNNENKQINDKERNQVKNGNQN